MRLPLFALLIGLAAAGADDAPTPESTAVREVSAGIYQIGQLRLEQEARRIVFPAEVNMTNGLLEYLLVSKDGPRHESLLATDVSPSDLHLAMLLLGAKGDAKLPAGQGNPPAQINREYLQHAPQLTGERISLSVRWKDKEGKENTAPAEDWLTQLNLKKAPPRGPWTYTGSSFGSSGKFMAQLEGLFVALVTNPAALINNPRPGHDDDQLWTVNEKAVPPLATPVQLEVKLLDPPAAPEAK